MDNCDRFLLLLSRLVGATGEHADLVGVGARTVAVYVKRTAGVSCNGTHDRARFGSDWVNRKGLPEAV